MKRERKTPEAPARSEEPEKANAETQRAAEERREEGKRGKGAHSPSTEGAVEKAVRPAGQTGQRSLAD